MTDEPRGDEHGGPTAPWERTRRWNQDPQEPTRVEELLARLGTTGTGGRRRRRESDEETEQVSASDLIAALAPDTEQPEPNPPAPAGPPTSQPTPPTAQPVIPPATDADRTTQVARTTADPDHTVLIHPARPHPGPADDSHTEIIPRIGARDPDGVESIRARLARESAAAAVGAASAPTAIAAPARARTPHPRRTLLVAGRSAIAVLTAVTLFITGWYWTIMQRTESGLQERQVEQVLNTTDPHIVTPTVHPTTPAGVEIYEPQNILLLGSDTRSGANGDAGNTGDGTADSANSDTMMIAHLSADRQHVTILSLPRDTVIPAPQCKAWNFETGKLSTEDYPGVDVGAPSHLNSTFSMGGPTCVVKALQEMTGIRIDKYIGIDFVGFKSMVDAVGGIKITTCGPITDTTLGAITDHGGPQVFTGEAALSLVRARHVPGEKGSDLARIKRQQAVLSALLRQVTSAGTLANPVKLDNFLQAFVHNTFNSGVTLESLIEIAGSLGTFSPDTVTFYTLPTYDSDRVEGGLEIDKPKAQAIFNSIINDTPLPGQKVGDAVKTTPATTKSATPPTTASSAAPDLTLTVAPADVPLKIYNVTGAGGVAGQAQQALDEVGFKVTEDDLVRPENDVRQGITVEYAPAQRAAALTVAAAVPGATLVVDDSLSGEVRLMLGSDFDGTVRAVKVGQKAPASLTSVATTGGDGPATDSTGQGQDGTSTAPATTTIKASDLSSYNAANTNCVGPPPNAS